MTLNITRRDLAKALKERVGETIQDHEKTISNLLEIISEEVAAGKRVQLRRFGTFESRQIKAHKTINPVTTKKMKIPKSYTVDFRPSEALKKTLREQNSDE